MQQPTSKCAYLRIGIASMLLLPAILFSSLNLVALPDLETWLKHHAGEYFRRDAFDGLDKASVPFAVTLAVTSLFAVYFVLRHRSQFLLPLAAGPGLAIVCYLISNGISDPAWFTLLALMTIGMFVGTPVTFVWALFTKHQPEFAPTEGRQIG